MVVVAVLALLVLYAYLFTHAADRFDLPRPQDLAGNLGVHVHHVFDDDRNVDSRFGILMARGHANNDDERLTFLLVLAAAFLCVYFLPLRFKQGSLAFWTVTAVVLLYGAKAALALLFAHLVVYLVLHPPPRKARTLVLLAGVAAYGAFLHDHERGVLRILPALGSLAIAVIAWRWALRPALDLPRVARALRAGVVHAAIGVMGIAVLAEALGAREWKLPLGIVLFFWQWARLAMYHVDYNDGLVPEGLSLDRYLAVFFNPGVLPNWSWGVTIAQGFAYVDGAFLARDKNSIVIEGVKLMGLALLYLVLADWLRWQLVELFAHLDIPVYRANTRAMVGQFMRGAEVSGVSVLATTLLDLFRFFLFFASVMHLKVGVWRICGYAVDPYYNRPWLATDLMSLWGRFAFHYREFMVRVFYYPVFFRVFRRRPMLRVFTASMAAACAGNMLWHFSERTLFRGMELDSIEYVLGTWPYFVLLGLGIAVTQIVLMRRRRRRKPWSLDRWLPRDILAAYLVLQYFALIHIFARPSRGSSEWDLLRLFARAFGVDLPA